MQPDFKNDCNGEQQSFYRDDVLAAICLPETWQRSRKVARPHSQAYRQRQAGRPAPPPARRVHGVVQPIFTTEISFLINRYCQRLSGGTRPPKVVTGAFTINLQYTYGESIDVVFSYWFAAAGDGGVV